MTEFNRKPIEGIMALAPACVNDDQTFDHKGIRSNIEWLEEQGIHGFIQFSSMGQIHTPSEEEFNEITDICVETAEEITCVIGCSGPNQKEAIRRATYAENAGADGAMIELPYMLPVQEDWVGQFYRDINNALNGEIAIMVYNYPPATQCNITPSVWREELLDINSIKAVKDSNTNIDHHNMLRMEVSDKVNWISKSDPNFWEDSLRGGKGFISVLSWVAPQTCLRFHRECRDGNHFDSWVNEVDEKIKRAWWTFKSLPDCPLASYEFAILNRLAEINGRPAGPPRLPYQRLPPDAVKALGECVKPLMRIEKELETGLSS